MAEDRMSWVLRKAAIALPVVLVLALARCSGGGGGTEEQAASEGAAQDTAPVEQSAKNAGEAQKAASSEVEQGDDSAATSEGEQGDDSATKDEGDAETETEYGAEAIKAAMRRHIARRTRLGNPGVFEIVDPRTSQTLQLRFQKIHDPVRTLEGDFYFACTNFSVIGEPDKTFDLDFWLQPHQGELVVYQENVHKVPVREDGEWVQKPHYNFVDDRINLIE